MVKDQIRVGGPLTPSETVLEDDYPVFWGYCYVADGKVIQSKIIAGDVAELKRFTGAQEIRRCDLVGRQVQDSEPTETVNLFTHRARA